jgi:hypothetical protein
MLRPIGLVNKRRDVEQMIAAAVAPATAAVDIGQGQAVSIQNEAGALIAMCNHSRFATASKPLAERDVVGHE